MHRNRVKEKIAQGKLAIGAFVTLADPAVVEMIGLAGYDAAYIDMEHTAFDMRLVQDMVRACDVVGICSLVRVPENNPKTILRVLEMGAQAVQVLHEFLHRRGRQEPGGRRQKLRWAAPVFCQGRSHLRIFDEVASAVAEKLSRRRIAFQSDQKGFHRLGKQGACGALVNQVVGVLGEHGQQLRAFRGIERGAAAANGQFALAGRAAGDHLVVQLRTNGSLRQPSNQPA